MSAEERLCLARQDVLVRRLPELLTDAPARGAREGVVPHGLRLIVPLRIRVQARAAYRGDEWRRCRVYDAPERVQVEAEIEVRRPGLAGRRQYSHVPVLRAAIEPLEVLEDLLPRRIEERVLRGSPTLRDDLAQVVVERVLLEEE